MKIRTDLLRLNFKTLKILCFAFLMSFALVSCNDDDDEKMASFLKWPNE